MTFVVRVERTRSFRAFRPQTQHSVTTAGPCRYRDWCSERPARPAVHWVFLSLGPAAGPVTGDPARFRLVPSLLVETPVPVVSRAPSRSQQPLPISVERSGCPPMSGRVSVKVCTVNRRPPTALAGLETRCIDHHPPAAAASDWPSSESDRTCARQVARRSDGPTELIINKRVGGYRRYRDQDSDDSTPSDSIKRPSRRCRKSIDSH